MTNERKTSVDFSKFKPIIMSKDKIQATIVKSGFVVSKKAVLLLGENQYCQLFVNEKDKQIGFKKSDTKENSVKMHRSGRLTNQCLLEAVKPFNSTIAIGEYHDKEQMLVFTFVSKEDRK